MLGFALLILSHLSYISHENEIISTELFHFHRIFKKNRGGEGGRASPLDPSGSVTATAPRGREPK